MGRGWCGSLEERVAVVGGGGGILKKKGGIKMPFLVPFLSHFCSCFQEFCAAAAAINASSGLETSTETKFQRGHN